MLKACIDPVSKLCHSCGKFGNLLQGLNKAILISNNKIPKIAKNLSNYKIGYKCLTAF